MTCNENLCCKKQSPTGFMDSLGQRCNQSNILLNVENPSYDGHFVSPRFFLTQGQYYSRGDIVSVVDVEGGVYYAQLKGFLTDQYCEKSGVITWLLPTTDSPPPEEGFDPSTYIIGRLYF